VLKNFFLKQVMMRKVLYTLIPLQIFSIYLYGLNALIIQLVTFPIAIVTEYYMEKAKKKKVTKVSEAVLVTASLYSLSLPPSLGDFNNIWIVIVGIIFAVVFAKMAFGGFGRNAFNPAVAGRLFIYTAFPAALAGGWVTSFNFNQSLDAYAGATALAALQQGNPESLPLVLKEAFNINAPLWVNLFLGFQSGSLGESSALLILLGGLYLVKEKIASPYLMFSPIISAFLLMTILKATDISQVSPINGIFSGSIIFASVFMVTEPVTGPKKMWAQIIYGSLIGIITILLREFTALPTGMSYAIIIGNSFAIFIDNLVPKPKKKPVVKKG